MVGAPGSGKGTQGEYLATHTGFKRYVMSDLIKKKAKPGSEFKEKMLKGELLNNTDIFNIFRSEFKAEKQVILDGLPRDIDQAYWLYGFLIKHNYEIMLLYLEMDEKKLVKRITSRVYCNKCHTQYNLITNKPKKTGFCDNDNEKLLQRPDDTAEIFKDRLKTFNEVKNIIMKVYKGELIKINGDQDIKIVSREMMKKILIRE
jgi:adenylate kinase